MNEDDFVDSNDTDSSEAGSNAVAAVAVLILGFAGYGITSFAIDVSKTIRIIRAERKLQKDLDRVRQYDDAENKIIHLNCHH